MRSEEREARLREIQEHVKARPYNYHPDFHFLLSEIKRLTSAADDKEHDERIESYMKD